MLYTFTLKFCLERNLTKLILHVLIQIDFCQIDLNQIDLNQIDMIQVDLIQIDLI